MKRREPTLEERLDGGNSGRRIVRVGNTVRRPTGPWTPAVHDLLSHLADQGVQHSPRVLGIDDQGREMLAYVEGPVVWPDHVDRLSPDDRLAAVGRAVRSIHDAVATFEPRPDHRWSDRAADRHESPELICHNDLASWNLVDSPRGWVFIDWDLAAPGRRTWDLAWAACSCVPLSPDGNLDDRAVVDRLQTLCSGYGRIDLATEIIELAGDRCRREANLIEGRGREGEEPFATLLADGHGRAWTRTANHIAQRRDRWMQLLPSAGSS